MTSRIRYILQAAASALGILLLVGGCDTTGPADFTEEYVVESYQRAGGPLAPVRISRVAAIDDRYDVVDHAVRGARVFVHLLDSDGGVEEAFEYREEPTIPGTYLPLDEDLILPLRTYELEVFADENVIRSRTVVPDTFSLLSVSNTEVLYQGLEQVRFQISRPTYPGRQSIFIFSTESLAPAESLLVPLARNRFDEDDATLEDFRKSESFPLNEDNFDRISEDVLEIRFPWIAFSFFGPNRIFVQMVDDNLFDFIRSQSVQQGGSTLPPGEIPNVLDQVEGGRGIFGSYASVEIDVFVRRPED